MPLGQALWSEVCKEALKQCEGHRRASHFPPGMLLQGAEASGAARRAPRPPSPPRGVPGMRLDRRPQHCLAGAAGQWPRRKFQATKVTHCTRESETTELSERLRGALRAEAAAGTLGCRKPFPPVETTNTFHGFSAINLRTSNMVTKQRKLEGGAAPGGGREPGGSCWAGRGPAGDARRPPREAATLGQEHRGAAA